MRHGTSFQFFNQLGSTKHGTPMAVLSMPEVNTARPINAPRGPIARLKNGMTPLDAIINTAFDIQPDYNDLTDQYSGFTGNLSPGIRKKAKRFGVSHIVGRHAYESNFAGGIDLNFSDLRPSEILAYNDFYNSLSNAEQDEYASFLGLEKIGKALGSAAKAVGKVAAGAAKVVAKGAVGVAKGAAFIAKPVIKLGGKIGTGIAHTVRDIGVGVAHVGRDIGIGVAHAGRAAGKFTWKNLPYIVAAATAFIPGVGPEIAAGLFSAIAAMKSNGASDEQIADYLNTQTGGQYDGGYGSSGADPGAYEDSGEYDQQYPDFPSIDETDISPDANGNITFPDGSVYNVNTQQLTTPGGTTGAPKPVDEGTDWLMWGAIAAAVILVGYYLYKQKAFDFKWLKK